MCVVPVMLDLQTPKKPRDRRIAIVLRLMLGTANVMK